MNIREARKLLAVQAIEQSDGEEVVFSEKDRRECAAMAGAPLPKDSGRFAENRFLFERADLLLARGESRFADSIAWARFNEGAGRFRLFLGSFVVLAAVAGFLTNELGPEKRINILSFPLLGILGWNIVVTVREIWLVLRSREKIAAGEWAEQWGGFFRRGAGREEEAVPEAGSEADPVLSTAAALFQRRWRSLLAPVTVARFKSALHVGACVFALAAIGGMYLRGLANEYKAVWESTFFEDGASIRPFLDFVLGPAAALTGDRLPDADELDQMRWEAGENEVAGENAARWIHWYAITIALFVILPRLVFALLWSARAKWFASRLPIREVSPGWFEHLLHLSSGAALEIAVLPYGVGRTPDREKAMERFLENRFERSVDLEWLPEVPFGEEDTVEVANVRKLIPLMSFSATPEKETHRLLLETLLAREADSVESLLLDAAAFDERSVGLPDAPRRKEDRNAAWDVLLSGLEIELMVFPETKGKDE